MLLFIVILVDLCLFSLKSTRRGRELQRQHSSARRRSGDPWVLYHDGAGRKDTSLRPHGSAGRELPFQWGGGGGGGST